MNELYPTDSPCSLSPIPLLSLSAAQSIRTDYSKRMQTMEAHMKRQGKQLKGANAGLEALRSDATTFQAALDLKLNMVDSTLREHAPLLKGLSTVETLNGTLRSVESHTRECVTKVEQAAARQENSEKWLQQMRAEMISLRDQVRRGALYRIGVCIDVERRVAHTHGLLCFGNTHAHICIHNHSHTHTHTRT